MVFNVRVMATGNLMTYPLDHWWKLEIYLVDDTRYPE